MPQASGLFTRAPVGTDTSSTAASTLTAVGNRPLIEATLAGLPYSTLSGLTYVIAPSRPLSAVTTPSLPAAPTYLELLTLIVPGKLLLTLGASVLLTAFRWRRKISVVP